MSSTTVRGNTGTVKGCEIKNCNLSGAVIYNYTTIHVPETQDIANECGQSSSEDEVIRKYLLSTQQQLCRNAKRFTPATLNTRYDVDIADMFTDLDLLKEGKKKQDVKPTTLKEVLNIIKSTPACKVLIEGEGGIGKSTLLRYLAYNWASDKSDETFKGKIVFLVNMSSIGKGETILDGILKQIDLEDFDLETRLSKDPLCIKRFIRNQSNDMVLLLDGLDELKEGGESPIGLFKNNKMGKCKVILTSRSENINEFIKESNIHVKVKGFNTDNIMKYIGKHFTFFEEPALGDSLIKTLELAKVTNIRLNHQVALSLCKNPMLLLSVCILWENERCIPTDVTDLFKEIFRCILNQFIDKQVAEEQKISKFKDIPKRFVKAMMLLGKCMYEGLKINKLTINKRDLNGNEETVALALKLGFVYKNAINLKSDFEEIYSAPHKLIVETLVGFYLYKLCHSGLKNECSEDLKQLHMPLEDNEWQIIISNAYFYMARKFAVGFLGAEAGKFLKHWITNDIRTYRSLMPHLNLLKEEHAATVENALIDHMTKAELEINPLIDDICRTLKRLIQHIFPNGGISPNEHFIQLMRRFSDKRPRPCGPFLFGEELVETHIESFCKAMSSEEKGRMAAHILFAVPVCREHVITKTEKRFLNLQRLILNKISSIFGDDEFKYLEDELRKLNFKYGITKYDLDYTPMTTSYLFHQSNSPKRDTALPTAYINPNIDVNMITECCRQGITLHLQNLVISGNNLSHINGSLFASCVITQNLISLIMCNCSLSGVFINNMIRECCSRGVFKLKLSCFHIGHNNLSNLDGSLFASFLCLTPNLNNLTISNCILSGDIMNDMIRECSNGRVKLMNFYILDISCNNLCTIDGYLLSLLFDITPLSFLKISNCRLSGDVMDNMIRTCSNRGINLNLNSLDISGNNFSKINGSLFSSLFAISPGLKFLHFNNCVLSGVIINNIFSECSSRGVELKLNDMDISENNLSNIDLSLFSSLSALSCLKMKNCSLSGKIMNNMIRDFSNREVKLEIKSLDISDNELSNIDGSFFSALFVITPRLGHLKMSNCSLSGDIMDNIIRECSSRGVNLDIIDEVNKECPNRSIEFNNHCSATQYINQKIPLTLENLQAETEY